MALLSLCYLITLGFIASLLYKKRHFDELRDSISYRIHVNGIRGKSSVARYVAAILRDAGLRTYGKTTGTAARVILPNGHDAAIPRPGYANVSEQIGMISSFAEDDAQAIVMECMAINPDYQDWLESKLMHSQIAIITNVRIDHQEQMGETLADIARSMSRSIPHNSVLITAEQNPEILEIFFQECQRRQSRLLLAPINSITAADVASFGHVAHPDNVAIGVAVATMLGIPAQRAIRAMALAPPDPGAFHLEHLYLFGKDIIWANLFAVNDKESFAQIARMLAQSFPTHYRIAMLNNREDRPSRVEMFVKLAEEDYLANAIVALGDYEQRVSDAAAHGQARVALMGNTSRYAKRTGASLMRSIVGLSDRPSILLVGTVNIHTLQSQHILEYLSHFTGENSLEEIAFYRPHHKRRRSRLSQESQA